MGIIIAVVLTIGIVQTVHAHEESNHQSQVLGVYDKCLYESSDGADCQTIRNDCANGDSYACHLASVIACVSQYGAGCPND